MSVWPESALVVVYRALWGAASAYAPGDGGRGQVWIIDGRQWDIAHAVAVERRQVGGCFDRQARLADAAGADECEQTYGRVSPVRHDRERRGEQARESSRGRLRDRRSC